MAPSMACTEQQPSAYRGRPHALVVPARPTGHIIACMRLARALSAAGFAVSFVYFSSSKLEGKLMAPPQIINGSPSSDVDHVNGFLGNDGGINTFVIEDGIPPEHRAKPFFATPAMKDNLLNLIVELREQGRTPPSCLVSDSFVPWTAHVAQSVAIPRIEFWTSNALSYLLNLNVPVLRRTKAFPERSAKSTTAPPRWKSESPLMLDNIPCLPPISSELYPVQIRFDEESSPFLQIFHSMCSAVELGDRVLIYSISELEPDAFRGLQAMGVSAYAIAGPLLHHSFETQEHKQQHGTSAAAQEPSSKSDITSAEQRSDCLIWLDSHAESSVIYVAFGTVATLSPQDVQELAMGLDASGHPYLWAIRDDSHSAAGSHLNRLFEGRTCEHGMVTSWAPQVKVLAHKAIGGFLTHCGWNSTVESLSEGVPMLCCPQLGDQRSNMWCVCNVWGNGLELERTESGGLERTFVEAGVRSLLRGGEGLRARGRAKEVKELVRKACQVGSQSFCNLQKLYDDMEALTCAKIPIGE